MDTAVKILAERINNQNHLSDEEKSELLGLLAKVVEEIDDQAPAEKIQPVRDTVAMTADIREQSIPEQLERSLLELEATYPVAAGALGRIAQILARMGI